MKNKFLLAIIISSFNSFLHASTLNPALNPSANFDLSPFELITSHPLGLTGGAINIQNAELVGDTHKNTGYTNFPYFYTDLQTGAMVFFSPVGGATTKGTPYARTELTESTAHEWMIETPFHRNVLSASLKVDALPSNNIVTIGQIHDRGDTDILGNAVHNKPLLKVMYSTNALIHKKPCGGCVYAEILPAPAMDSSEEENIVIKTGIKLHTLITYAMILDNHGRLTIKVLGKKINVNMSLNKDNTQGWGSQNLLFHAGCYLHQTGESVSEGGKVSFYSLNVKHYT